MRFRSEKYDWNTLLYSFYIIEVTRFNYIKGYLKGLLEKTEVQEIGLKKLKTTL
ncbi:hypothetical protein BH23BAC1_BH23BAC1_21210 [soil metagenome]